MRRWMGAALVLTLALSACAEAGNGFVSPTGTGGGAPDGGSGGGSGTTGTGASATTGTGGGASGVASVVINEISAKGEDWVEIANAGTETVDLGGYGLCDDDATGTCDMTTIIHFPEGTTLKAGKHLVIVCDSKGSNGEVSTDCLGGSGPSKCFHAGWKVSDADGEMVHFVDADGKVVSEAKYPKEAVTAGHTWGRIPDLTGAFEANDPTPGDPNEAK